MAYGTCFNINKYQVFCLLKFCILYFIGFMLNNIALALALEILISVRWPSKYKQIVNRRNSTLANLLVTVIGFMLAFSPLLFGWNHFEKDCDCGHNNVLPRAYILVILSMFFAFSLATLLVYLCILNQAKSAKQKV